jgi:membrane-bound lytic murein transglycosylase MltF
MGDFDEMRKLKAVRILVPNSKTIFFLDKGTQRGTAAEFGRAFADWLNKKYKLRKAQEIHVVFIPTPRERLLSDLAEGYGDIAAGNLTVTDERLRLVDFTDTRMGNVKEIVVSGPGKSKMGRLDDLAGKEVYIRKTSSYFEHVAALNKERKASGKAGIAVKVADEDLEDEDILEMVNAGLVPMTIVDDHVARLWTKVFPKLVLHDEVAVNEGGEIAWALRRGTPLLKSELADFGKRHGPQTAFWNALLAKYYSSGTTLKNATSKSEMQKFNQMVELFKKYGAQYEFEPLMLMAQGYQESRLDQSAVSHVGAVGVMQVLPTTAEAKPIAIPHVKTNTEQNIHAGTKYLRHVVDTYLNDPKIDAKNRTLMAFAAYNAGPGNLRKFRRLTEKAGNDPNVWFNNVELAAARITGQETVRYVANIYKYYVAYTLNAEQEAARRQAVETQRKAQ